MVLATGKRQSELHALQHGVRWVKGRYRKVELIPSPSFISKTHLAADVGALRPFTHSSFYELAGREGKVDKLLCPIRTLCYYLKRSDSYHSPEHRDEYHGAHYFHLHEGEAIVMAYASSSKEVALTCFLFNVGSAERGAWTTPNVFISFYLQDFTVDTLTNLCSETL